MLRDVMHRATLRLLLTHLDWHHIILCQSGTEAWPRDALPIKERTLSSHKLIAPTCLLLRSSLCSIVSQSLVQLRLPPLGLVVQSEACPDRRPRLCPPARGRGFGDQSAQRTPGRICTSPPAVQLALACIQGAQPLGINC